MMLFAPKSLAVAALMMPPLLSLLSDNTAPIIASAALQTMDENESHVSSNSRRRKLTTLDAASQYNTLITLCPGYETQGLMGYTTLEALASDLEGYFHSLTYAPTISLVPTSTPTSNPTVKPTNSPSKDPTPPPSEIPTKAPITLRPTPFPQSSIFVSNDEPTKSPSPTVEMVIVGGPPSGGGPTGPTRMLMDEVRMPIIEADDLVNEDGEDTERLRLRGDKNSLPPVQSLLYEDHYSESDTELLEVADASIELEDKDLIDQLVQEVMTDAIYDTNTMPSSAFVTESQQDNNHKQGWKDHVTNHLLEDGELITFNICPNTTFSFIDSSADTLMNETVIDPLALETPLRNPIAIHCLDDNVVYGTSDIDNHISSSPSCVFEGGKVHLFINNDAFDEDAYMEDLGYEVYVSGITFRGATQASILMNDPRGNVHFNECTWENNTGIAIFVDGKWMPPATTTTSSTIDWSILGSTTSSTNFGRELFDIEDMGDALLVPSDEVVGEILGGGIEMQWQREESFSNQNFMSATMATAPASTSLEHKYLLHDEIENGEEDEAENMQQTVTATASTAPAWNSFHQEAELQYRETEVEYSEEDYREFFDINDNEENEHGSRLDLFLQNDEDVMQQTIRMLDDHQNYDEYTRSIVSIEKCAFTGNKGNATIMVTSYSEYTTDPTVAAVFSHSIHLKMKETAFTSEHVESSVIVNSGGRLQSSGCLFSNNTAESIIRSERATMELLRTKFSDNEVNDDGGIVVLDVLSELDVNERNCAPPSGDGSVGSNMTRDLASTCDGILSGDSCQEFDDSCVQRDSPETPTTTTTAATAKPTKPTRKPKKDKPKSNKGTGEKCPEGTPRKRYRRRCKDEDSNSGRNKNGKRPNNKNGIKRPSGIGNENRGSKSGKQSQNEDTQSRPGRMPRPSPNQGRNGKSSKSRRQ